MHDYRGRPSHHYDYHRRPIPASTFTHATPPTPDGRTADQPRPVRGRHPAKPRPGPFTEHPVTSRYGPPLTAPPPTRVGFTRTGNTNLGKTGGWPRATRPPRGRRIDCRRKQLGGEADTDERLTPHRPVRALVSRTGPEMISTSPTRRPGRRWPQPAPGHAVTGRPRGSGRRTSRNGSTSRPQPPSTRPLGHHDRTAAEPASNRAPRRSRPPQPATAHSRRPRGESPAASPNVHRTQPDTDRITSAASGHQPAATRQRQPNSDRRAPQPPPAPHRTVEIPSSTVELGVPSDAPTSPSPAQTPLSTCPLKRTPHRTGSWTAGSTPRRRCRNRIYLATRRATWPLRGQRFGILGQSAGHGVEAPAVPRVGRPDLANCRGDRRPAPWLWPTTVICQHRSGHLHPIPTGDVGIQAM
jgi:hypothetical protein